MAAPVPFVPFPDVRGGTGGSEPRHRSAVAAGLASRHSSRSRGAVRAPSAGDHVFLSFCVTRTPRPTQAVVLHARSLRIVHAQSGVPWRPRPRARSQRQHSNDSHTLATWLDRHHVAAPPQCTIHCCYKEHPITCSHVLWLTVSSRCTPRRGPSRHPTRAPLSKRPSRRRAPHHHLAPADPAH